MRAQACAVRAAASAASPLMMVMQVTYAGASNLSGSPPPQEALNLGCSCMHDQAGVTGVGSCQEQCYRRFEHCVQQLRLDCYTFGLDAWIYDILQLMHLLPATLRTAAGWMRPVSATGCALRALDLALRNFDPNSTE